MPHTPARPVLALMLGFVAALGLVGCGGSDTAGPATAPVLVITTSTTLPDGAVGAAYGQAIDATGGTGTGYAWSVIAGTLPAGLTLSAAGTPSAALSGTPTAAGTANFTVQVQDSLGATASAAFTLAIAPALAITTTTLPDGTVGAAYSQALDASGGSGAGYLWSVSAGALPAGLTLGASGTPSTTLSGTPAAPGTFSFTVQVTDSASNSATQALSIVIVAPLLDIDSPSAPEGDSGTTPLTFTVTLSAALTSVVTVDYATADGTATAPADYAATSGTLTFAAGVTSQPIAVSLVGDTAVEPDETLAVTLSNPTGGATLGTAVGTGTITNDDVPPPVPGDFNGDGFADLIVGARWAADTGAGAPPTSGEAYLYFGSSTPAGTLPTSAANVRFTNIGVGGGGDGLGISVALGDVNGDGFADAIVGAYHANAPSSNSGAAYVFFGSATPPATLDTGSADLVLQGELLGDEFGFVTASGDLNGDGIDDIVVAAEVADPAAGVDAGAVYVFFGAATLPASIGATAADVTFTGAAAGDFFGFALALGDVDNDGFDDLLVGALLTAGGTGAAYVFNGSAALTGTIAASAADFTITGSALADRLGVSVALGDVDNDGFDDLLVGAYLADGPGGLTDAGAAYVFFGSATLTGSASAAGADTILKGAGANDEFGLRVATGDVNGDGFADLIVSADLADGGGTDTGAVYVFFGAALVPSVLQAGVDNDIGTNGEASGDKIGTRLAAGDINGDGFAEVFIAAAVIDQVYGFLGLANPPAGRRPSTADLTLLATKAGDELGTGLAAGP